MPERIELVGDAFTKAIDAISRRTIRPLADECVRAPTDPRGTSCRGGSVYRMEPEERCPALGDTDAFCRGTNVPEESRLLVSGLGVRRTTLYAWPTSEGWVCWAWDAGAGGCAPNFANDDRVPVAMTGIDPDKLGVGAPGVVVGIVPDDVVAASVKVDGVEYAAVVDRNGFFFELPTAKCSPKSFNSIWLTFSDGPRGQAPHAWRPGIPGRSAAPKCP